MIVGELKKKLHDLPDDAQVAIVLDIPNYSHELVITQEDGEPDELEIRVRL